MTDLTLLLCDEPTGDLDRQAGDEILDLLQALNAQHGKTIVMVTHDARAAGPPHAAPLPGKAHHRGLRVKFLPLVWRNLLRRKVRTTFTLLSIVVAFVLFGYLSAIRVAFGMGVDVAGRRPHAGHPQGCRSSSPCRRATSDASRPPPGWRTSAT